MDKFRFEVTLSVAVDAFDGDDAQIIIQDYLGVGEMDSALTITRIRVAQQ